MTLDFRTLRLHLPSAGIRDTPACFYMVLKSKHSLMQLLYPPNLVCTIYRQSIITKIIMKIMKIIEDYLLCAL